MSKECEIKNGTRAMTTAENTVFIGLWYENCCIVGGLTFGGGTKIW